MGQLGSAVGEGITAALSAYRYITQGADDERPPETQELLDTIGIRN